MVDTPKDARFNELTKYQEASLLIQPFRFCTLCGQTRAHEIKVGKFRKVFFVLILGYD